MTDGQPKTKPGAVCVGCKEPIEPGSATCDPCWKKLDKSTRVEFLEARKAWRKNTSTDPDRVSRKKRAILDSVERIARELNPPPVAAETEK